MSRRGGKPLKDGKVTGSTKKSQTGANIAIAIAAVGATAAARKASTVTWKLVTGEAPPEDPRSPDVDWRVAVLWAVASGTAIGIARLAVQRGLAARLGS
jgi:hypothetical protein